MDTPASCLVRFGVFELDVRAGELWRGGRRVALQPQPLEILRALIERPGEVVTREELRHRLWSNGAYVDFERSLNKAVVKLRDALGDDADSPRYIETLPRHGYRFIPLPQVGARVDGAPVSVPGAQTRWRAGRWITIAAVALVLLGLATVALLVDSRGTAVTSPAEYELLTDVIDSATAPALSPDGRMLAFIRGGAPFLSLGQIWLKLLPDGEPVQLTHSAAPIFAPTFTPDGAHIAYSATFDTWVVPVTGGEPALLLSNASGLTYIGSHEVMFSEFKTGMHVGLVASLDDRSRHREIYLPEHERGMAHYSYLSPDRKSVLVVEMDGAGEFQRCRLVPFAGGGPGDLVGPAGSCTSAAWSADGKWMYFGARVAGRSHLWRQRYPHGEPEQITFGPTEEETVIVSADGRALLASVGTERSSIWMHDGNGERILTTEGYARQPWLSADAQRVYFLAAPSSADTSQLWRLNVASGRKELVLAGLVPPGYDISYDERQVVFTTKRAGIAEIWIAPLDRHAPPRLLIRGGDEPKFDRYGRVLFRSLGERLNYLHRINADGSESRRVFEMPITTLEAVAPEGDWVAMDLPPASGRVMGCWLVPLDGGAPYLVSEDWLPSRWSRDGKLLYVEVGTETEHPQGSPVGNLQRHGRTVALRLGGDGRPTAPVIPIPPDAALIPHPELSLAVGPDPSVYAFDKVESRRNIYRIPLH